MVTRLAEVLVETHFLSILFFILCAVSVCGSLQVMGVLTSSDSRYKMAGSRHAYPSSQTLTKEGAASGRVVLLSLSGGPRVYPQHPSFPSYRTAAGQAAISFSPVSTKCSPSSPPGRSHPHSLAFCLPHHRELYACERFN